jgi:hypothetical protein
MADVDNLRIVVELVDEFSEEVDELITEIEKLGQDIDELDNKDIDLETAFHYEEELQALEQRLDLFEDETELTLDVDIAESEELAETVSKIESLEDLEPHVSVDFDEEGYESVVTKVEDVDGETAEVTVRFDRSRTDQVTDFIGDLKSESVDVDVGFDVDEDTDLLSDIDTEVEATLGFTTDESYEQALAEIDNLAAKKATVDIDFKDANSVAARGWIEDIDDEWATVPVYFNERSERVRGTIADLDDREATVEVDFEPKNVQRALDRVEREVTASYSDVDSGVPDRDPIEVEVDFDVERTDLDRALDRASATRTSEVRFQPITEHVDQALDSLEGEAVTVPVHFTESSEEGARATIERLDGREIEVDVDFNQVSGAPVPPTDRTVAVEFTEENLNSIERRANSLEDDLATVSIDFEADEAAIERAIQQAEGREAQVRATLDPDFEPLREEIAAIEEGTEVDIDVTVHIADEIRELNSYIRGLETEDVDIEARLDLTGEEPLLTQLEAFEEYEVDVPVNLEYEAALLEFYAAMEALETAGVHVPVYFDAKNDPSEGLGEIDIGKAEAGAIFGGDVPGFGAGENGRRRGGSTSGLAANVKELVGGLDDVAKGLTGRDHGGGKEGRSRFGRGVSRVSRSLSDLSLSMSSVHNLFAAFVPLLMVFIGALPAAIGGVLALAAAAATAAGALAAIGGLGALGFAMAQSPGDGMPSAEDFSEIGTRLTESFFESFAPLAEQLAPIFEDGLRGLEALFDEIAKRGDALLELRDEARAFGGFVLEYLPGFLARLAGMADQLSPVFGEIGKWLQNTDVVQGFIDLFYDAYPAIARFVGALIEALPMLLKLSTGLLHLASIVIGLISWVVQLADAIGIPGEALGFLLGVVLLVITAFSLLGSIAGAINAILLLTSQITLSSLVPSFIAAKFAALGLSGALYAIATAIAATGIGLLLVGLGILVGKLISADNKMQDLTDSIKDFDKQVGRTDGFNPYDPSGGGPQGPGDGGPRPGGRATNKTVNNYHASGDPEDDQMRMKKMQYDNQRAQARRSKK